MNQKHWVKYKEGKETKVGYIWCYPCEGFSWYYIMPYESYKLNKVNSVKVREIEELTKEEIIAVLL